MTGTAATRLESRRLEIDHPLIVREERRILHLKRSKAGSDVDTLIEIGQRLGQVRARIKRGQWSRWLARHVRFSHDTASRYMGLADFAASNYAALRSIKYLGPNKLYSLSRLNSADRSRLLTRESHSLRTWREAKTLEQMNLVEFNAVVRAVDSRVRGRSPSRRLALGQALRAAERLERVLPRLSGPIEPPYALFHRFRNSLRALQRQLPGVVRRLDGVLH